MFPIDSKTGKKWSPAGAQIMHQKIRRECVERMRRWDADRGADNPTYRFVHQNKMLEPAQHDRLFSRRKNESEEEHQERIAKVEGSYVVDPVVAAIKHRGEHTVALIKKEWAEFCSEARDEDALVGEEVRNLARSRMKDVIDRSDEFLRSIDFPTEGTSDSSRKKTTRASA